MTREDGRTPNQVRPLQCRWDIAPHAAGSVLMHCGFTTVICAVTVENKAPRWKIEQNLPGGWVTSEYSMLPYSTLSRKARDISRGKLDGRSQEIQRLIGRSLRAITRLDVLGPRTFWVDCDVLQADGGTRTTAITGGYLALKSAIERLHRKDPFPEYPLNDSLGAISVGLVNETPLLDLCYTEDRDASVDMNVVMTGSGKLIEIGASGEEATFSPEQLKQLLSLAEQGITEVKRFQDQCWLNQPDITSEHG